MLTPKHRALFAAAYGGAILRTAAEEPDLPAAGTVPGGTPPAKDADSAPEPAPR
jgi:hypothetical protein